VARAATALWLQSRQTTAALVYLDRWTNKYYNAFTTRPPAAGAYALEERAAGAGHKKQTVCAKKGRGDIGGAAATKALRKG